MSAVDQQYTLDHNSPLTTLVRKTSSRQPKQQLQRLQPTQGNSRERLQIDTLQEPYQAAHLPVSPLLHGTFNRQSSATWAESSYGDNDRNSYMDFARDGDGPELGYGYGGFENHSPSHTFSSTPTLKGSWQSGSDAHTVPGGATPEPKQTWGGIPAVYVSEHPTEQSVPGYSPYEAGKAAFAQPSTPNFTLPAHSAAEVGVPEAWETEQKRRVLERNASRRNAAKAVSSDTAHASRQPISYDRNARPKSATSSVYSRESAAMSQHINSTQISPVTPDSDPSHLTGRPPSLRPGSPVSLYSQYSYYQLDSASPSPTADKRFPPPSPMQSGPKRVAFSSVPSSPAPPSRSPAGSQTAQDFLQLGIQHHEADRLPESAIAFERAATVDGGCGVGMLMWGLAQRHGWGCKKNEKAAFKWLRRAAENAVDDLEAARSGGPINESAVQSELVLAVYEVGQCFFHGWGVPKDQKMGFSYYSVAARMGDADAQMDLGFCLANGKGAKKDRKEAAKWYRAAVKQGQSDVGLAWIYKEKFL